ncbi:MAG TPA: cytochrome c oxidase assembly protein [Solirubrobacterales bacterium]|nr:cytochrome c oxidase assembly protein [Solirubrobacterales bacterium]
MPDSLKAGSARTRVAQACFGVGLLIVLFADLPPLAGIAEQLIVAHMAQHLLIGDIAPF